MADIIDFPPPIDPNAAAEAMLVGPFETYRIVVDGRCIPHLTAFRDGDKIALVVDDRFSHSFNKADAYQAAWLIGNALAVGAGYSHIGAETKEQPFAPIMSQMNLGGGE